MEINKSLLIEVSSIIDNLKRNDSYNIFSTYFKQKSIKVLEELVSSAGTITQEELIKANVQLEVYRSLEEFDKTITSELNYN